MLVVDANNIYGSGQDEVGAFDIHGKWYADQIFNFKKQYRGMHAVYYDGKFENMR